MLVTVVNIALSYVGVVIFGAALILALFGAALLCIARKGDRPIEMSPRTAGFCAVFIGTVIASHVFGLLVDISLS